MAQGPPSATRGAFKGSVGSSLVDLLQGWSMDFFSGMAKVGFQGRTGQLYFVEGEIVHAEADGVVGEPAVRIMVGWSDGSFELLPNTTSLQRTIHKGLSYLLLDATRQLDGSRESPAAAGTAAAPAAAPGKDPSRPSVLDQVRAIRGVTGVALFGKDGRPSGDASPEAERLAAKGLYLAVVHAASVASAFGLHELGLATLQGERESLVLVHSHASYLSVAVAPGVPLEPVVAQLRGLLTRPAPR